MHTFTCIDEMNVFSINNCKVSFRLSQNENEMNARTHDEQSEIQTNGETESIFTCIGSHVGAFDLLSP